MNDDIIYLITNYVYGRNKHYVFELQEKIDDYSCGFLFKVNDIVNMSYLNREFVFNIINHEHIFNTFNNCDVITHCKVPNKYWFSSGKNNLRGYFD